MCNGTYVEVKGQLAGISALLPPVGSGIKLQLLGLEARIFTG